MRILYLDIDTLRPDHLGCYGYHRKTSPNIDRIAAEGIRFDNCYTSDAPCLPSRTALFSGRFGIHTGVAGHGGTAADPFVQGPDRSFSSKLGDSSWMRCLRNLGYKTVSISPFGERHSAWHFYANFSEMHNPGGCGEDVADAITPIASDWIKRNAKSNNWFLHVNYWDPHTPYRAPKSFGNPFENEPIPEWYTEAVRQKHWAGGGSWSAQEGMGYGGPHPYVGPQYPRQPNAISSMQKAKQMFDGYDCGIRYADEHFGRLLNALADQNVLDDLIILISADHGENLGELNIYYDHQTADQFTTHLPFILRWPGTLAPGVNRGLHYHFDGAATLVELLGGAVPENWDGTSFADTLKNPEPEGREYLVISQAAHTCQRSVRFGDYICIRSYHDGYHAFPDFMLFDLKNDPHEQNDIAQQNPELVHKAAFYLENWYGDMMRTATHPQDPLWTVMHENGPLHTRVDLQDYVGRLKHTGREEWAKKLIINHPLKQNSK